MPFLKHFGLASYPFGLTPDASMYYPHPETEAILAALHFSLMRGDGLLKVVGEVGTGKTLLCRMLLRRMENEPVNIAYLNAPLGLDAVSIAAAVATEFGLSAPKTKKQDPATLLRCYLLAQHGEGRRNILVIDEAHVLGATGLEAVRLLSNLETDKDKLLQIVLFGQPELDRLLHLASLRQVLQRISFSFSPRPFSSEAACDYVRFRLAQASVKRTRKAREPLLPQVGFTRKASQAIARASHGLPRLIHVLADKALLAAYASGERTVDTPHVRVACKETDGLAFPYSCLKWF